MCSDTGSPASIWLQPNDEIALLNSLEWIPYAGWVTWMVQVMPVFFLAGGYANARGLRKVVEGKQLRRDWITVRTRRLFTPVIPLLLVWTLLILVLRMFVASEVVYAGAMSATVPLWFLAIYLVLTAATPLTHRWWRRFGATTIVVLAAASIGIDIVRFALDVPGIGYLNFLFVWATVHQLGYWWSSQDEGDGISAQTGWAVAGGALAVLVAVTWVGWYPVAMVGIPGAEVTNMTPPTFAMALLGLAQAGIIWGTQPAVRRITSKVRGLARSGRVLGRHHDGLPVAPLGHVAGCRGRTVLIRRSSVPHRAGDHHLVGNQASVARDPGCCYPLTRGCLCPL